MFYTNFSEKGVFVMIRFISIIVFIGLYFAASIIFFPILLLIGLFSKHTRDVISFHMVKWVFKVVLFMSGTKATVIGLENIPKDQAVLYVGNHRSVFDIILGYRYVPDLTGFISKKEVKSKPFLSQWMWFMNCLFLDRDDIKAGLQMILDAIELIKSGISVFIFPEGTRCKIEGEMLEFKEGSFKIATKSGCPIVPVAFSNTSTLFEDHFPKVTKGEVTIEFCKPIFPKELSRDEQKTLGKYTQNIIKETLEKNNCQLKA